MSMQYPEITGYIMALVLCSFEVVNVMTHSYFIIKILNKSVIYKNVLVAIRIVATCKMTKELFDVQHQ